MFALIGKGAEKGASASADVVGSRAFVLPRPLRRIARLLTTPALEAIDVPRHLGSLAAVGFLAATGLYGMALGGHTDHVMNVSTAAAGFAVEDVRVSGNRETSEIAILEVLGLDGQTSVMTLGLAEARAGLMALPWVESAELRKVYPNTIEVELVEREAFAIWQNGSDLILIERNGDVITAMDDRRFIDLPFYVGLGADARAADFERMIGAYPEIKKRVRAQVRVADRRWDLYLKNGVVVRLPEEGVDGALAELAAMESERELLSRDIAAVDLRLADRMVVRLTPDAAERRQAAIEERAKDLKAQERRI